MEVKIMTAKELLEQLESLRNERADFDDLEIYVDVITRQSYEREQAWDGEGEFEEDFVNEGSAFDLVVPTSYDLSGKEMIATGDYILIRSVELEEDKE